MKPIETFYKGFHFRSRLEARWAVFFDTMGFEWEYEPEGFSLEGDFDGDTLYYLPDFKLKEGRVEIYVEVKPNDDLEPDEVAKMFRFSREKTLIPVYGLPKPLFYEIWQGEDNYFGWDAIAFMYHKGEKGNFEGGMPEIEFGDDKLESACDAAKQARFEHGQKG